MLAMVASGCIPMTQLRTAPSPPPDILVACEKALLSGTIAGSQQDPRVAWVIAPTGRRVDVTWPFGFRAAFDPDLSIIAGDGSVVARSGQAVRLGGGFHPDTEDFAVCEVNGRLFLP
jgi:hypothetical protein